jgi:ferrous iron transport protein A
MKLSELKKGEKGTVVSINNANIPLKRRMLDMGITSGAEILVKKIAPLGDPICLELRGYELCLRKSDLSGIEVNKL